MDRVFAGKVWGAWHLSEAAADAELDFFLSTSSIASVWGGFGQSAYGAANAFLDGLASRLRERGIAGISVNFGPWSAGMADADSRARLDRRGIRTLSPADALAGLADVAAAMGLRTGLMTPQEAADAAIQNVRAFAGKAGLPTTLREVGVTFAELDQVARGALNDVYIMTNPRAVGEADARAICQAAW